MSEKKTVRPKITPMRKAAHWTRPNTVTIETTFGLDNRKVVPADLERAAAAAARAYRDSLEGRNQPYSIVDMDVTVEYSYRQSRKTLKG